MATSVGAHLVVPLLLWSLGAFDWPPALPLDAEEEAVEMVPVTASDWERNRATGAQAAAHTPGKHKDAATAVTHHAPEALPSGQVVDTATGNDQKPAETRFLSEHDNKVAKETRAREQTPFYSRAMAQQTTTHPPDPALKKTQQKEKGTQGTSEDAARREAKTEVARREIPAVAERDSNASLERAKGDAPTTDDAHTAHFNSSQLMIKPGSLASATSQPGSDGKAGSPDAPDNSNASGVTGDAVGAAPNDFLQGMQIGDGTFLNTREFKYASFFNRIKQAVGEQWSPNDVIRKKDPQGRRTLYQSRITVVGVTLDEDGNIVNIQVTESCGIDFLDVEAVAAFQRAQPFVNPPLGLLDADRHVSFRFGFHIDNDPTGVSPAMRGRWNRR